MMDHPHGHVALITALEEYIHHPEIIIIRSSVTESNNWHSKATQLYAPRRLVFNIPDNAKNLPGALAGKKAQRGKTIAYRCVGHHCSPPIENWKGFAAEITEAAVKVSS